MHFFHCFSKFQHHDCVKRCISVEILQPSCVLIKGMLVLQHFMLTNIMENKLLQNESYKQPQHCTVWLQYMRDMSTGRSEPCAILALETVAIAVHWDYSSQRAGEARSSGAAPHFTVSRCDSSHTADRNVCSSREMEPMKKHDTGVNISRYRSNLLTWRFFCCLDSFFFFCFFLVPSPVGLSWICSV